MNRKRLKIADLERNGWTKRFVVSEPRLGEAVDVYRASGFDVHLEPLPRVKECEACPGEGEDNECRICFEGFEDQYMIIFTRPAKGGACQQG